MLRVFIGYDEREADAWAVCAHTLRKHSSIPLAIAAVKQDRLRARGLYTRPADEPASTQFAHTRFLVPAMCNYEGFALFVDCDFLFTRDIAELWPHCNRDAAVNVVKHDYTPKSATKMDGQPQVAYPRKNWSSLMVFNCAALDCKALTADYVNSAPASDLHRFEWCYEESIHALPTEWNWLEGEYDPPGDGSYPAAIHFTNGGPWHEQHKGACFGDLWVSEHYAAIEEREKQN